MHKKQVQYIYLDIQDEQRGTMSEIIKYLENKYGVHRSQIRCRIVDGEIHVFIYSKFGELIRCVGMIHKYY